MAEALAKKSHNTSINDEVMDSQMYNDIKIKHKKEIVDITHTNQSM
jgi:hypothetical protein